MGAITVANIKILCTGDAIENVTPIVLGVCAGHKLAGATTYESKSYIWVGGQLTYMPSVIIEGITRPEYVKEIESYVKDYDAELTFVNIHEATSPSFIEWFESHI